MWNDTPLTHFTAGRNQEVPVPVCGVRVVPACDARTFSLDVNKVPIEDRTRLLSDNGPGYVSRAFRDYLGMVGIKHILGRR